MNDIETLLKAITGEMQKSMTAKSVVGEPMTIQETTIIPLISMGMGFGAGVGYGKNCEKGEGSGGGGGLGIKPVAVVIIDKSGAKLETLKGHHSMVEKLAEAIPKIAESIPKMREKQALEEDKSAQ